MLVGRAATQQQRMQVMNIALKQKGPPSSLWAFCSSMDLVVIVVEEAEEEEKNEAVKVK